MARNGARQDPGGWERQEVRPPIVSFEYEQENEITCSARCYHLYCISKRSCLRTSALVIVLVLLVYLFISILRCTRCTQTMFACRYYAEHVFYSIDPKNETLLNLFFEFCNVTLFIPLSQEQFVAQWNEFVVSASNRSAVDM